MAWESRDGRLYYYRSRRDVRKVRKEYCGSGLTGALAEGKADQECAERKEQHRRTEEWRKAWEADCRALEEFDRLVDMAVRASLSQAGYHQHQRGEWRRRRVRQSETP
jgi:hypothetical protein